MNFFPFLKHNMQAWNPTILLANQKAMLSKIRKKIAGTTQSFTVYSDAAWQQLQLKSHAYKSNVMAVSDVDDK